MRAKPEHAPMHMMRGRPAGVADKPNLVALLENLANMRLHFAHMHQIADETVAVVTHFFQVQTEDDALPTQLIIEVKKLDLDQYENKALSYEQLLGKMKMSEF